ncbi:unnamed protein product [Cyprideis torosa]|uniref:5'-Nucleotidase C-terminal domain-containing protein n=1 Tax=Cyprideis torosa TaxID=163714 RepID=A0A7R8ZQP9_9CRUS|nr:unnamed protein product [Cyprideis torosa]CAG0896917.1 unnamed protein product [Cyprideis torosa]
MGPQTRRLCVVHFNDVYNIESRDVEPCGGAARFVGAVKSFSSRNPLMLFSGDILAPSMMSTITRGDQMLPVCKRIGIHCAAFGNHDFGKDTNRLADDVRMRIKLIEVANDFGIPVLSKFVQASGFPWVSSNVIDKETGRPLAGAKRKHVMQWQGIRIGLVGLVEWAWLETLATVDPDEVLYEDFVETANRMARELRQQEGCELVILLTHMRLNNDIRLAEGIQDGCAQLILGGHDHDYVIREVNGVTIVKSGTDFREFSLLDLELEADGALSVGVHRVEVNSSFEEDEQLNDELAGFEGELRIISSGKGTVKHKFRFWESVSRDNVLSSFLSSLPPELVERKMDEVLGEVTIDLEGRFSAVRTQETNLGNFLTDVMVAACNTDCALLNSGTIRVDEVIPRGPFTQRDLAKTLPMLDNLVTILVNGKQLCDALENGVSKYPALEGRFPQVSGISFVFDPQKSPGHRVIRHLTRVGDEFVRETELYTLTTKEYLAKGKDGYDCLEECPVLVDGENSPPLQTAVMNHFEAVRMVRERERDSPAHRRWKELSHHRQSLVLLSRRHSMVQHISQAEQTGLD